MDGFKSIGGSATPIWVTTDHTGKMEGICSISTSVVRNPACQRNATVKGSICQHCFARAMMGMYPALEGRLSHNTELLSSRLLRREEIPDTTGYPIWRFEAFGDLVNETHLENYVNIALANPGTRFALWTKRYGLALKWFGEHPIPPNMNLIISSMMVNHPVNLDPFRRLGCFGRGQLKSFTVYDGAYVISHWRELGINCGSRYCMGCRLCYSVNDVEEIKEVLKSDQPMVERYLDTHDPERIERNRLLLEGLDEML